MNTQKNENWQKKQKKQTKNKIGKNWWSVKKKSAKKFGR